MKYIATLFLLSFMIIIASDIPVHAQNGWPIEYSFDKKKAPAEWSVRKTYQVADSRCLGPFNNRNKRYPSKVTLNIDEIPKDKNIHLMFDMIYIGSWDNDGKLADRFTISIADGKELLKITKFPCTLIENDDTRPLNHDGFVKVGKRDRAYWVAPVTVTINHSDIIQNKLQIQFKGDLTGRKTEFWAIDNVRVMTI